MKSYKPLSKLYYKDASSSRDSNAQKLLEERKDAPSSFTLGIDGINGEFFFAVPRELSILTDFVLIQERRVSELGMMLPDVAGREVLRNLVLDEVVSSNAIENIGSTKPQVEYALSQLSKDPVRNRFREFALLYLDLAYSTPELPKTPEDIRAIYDKVMAGEDYPKPDGKLFRGGPVGVMDGVKILHQGAYPESKIISGIKQVIKLANSNNIPSIYSAIAAHFIFEHIHPFYDGNGRTGRYLLSLMLTQSLSKATAVSLSRIIAKDPNPYYKAFQEAERPLNRSELTFFVYDILKLIATAQEDLITRYEINIARYKSLKASYEEMCKCKTFTAKESALIFALAQYKEFGITGEATLGDLAEFIEVGVQQTRKYLVRLEEQGIIRKTRGRNPIAFKLDDDFATKAFPYKGEIEVVEF